MNVLADLRLYVLMVALLLASALKLLAGSNNAIDRDDPQRTTIEDLGVHVFVRFEGPALVLSVTALIAAFWWLTRRGEPKPEPELPPLSGTMLPIQALALATFLVTLAGTLLVFHRHPLVCDEYLTGWQAEIFRHGQLTAVAERFVELADLICLG